MSDSEDTEPAIDDFESRFLEIDEMSDGLSTDSDYLPPSPSCSEENHTFPVSVFAQKCKQHITAEQTSSSSRPQRLKGKSRFHPLTVTIDTSIEQAKSSNLVRTRMGYQASQSSLWSLEDMTKGLQETPVIPTPEQLEARNQKIVRRRESAKHKAELEKRQTVEKLLRINTEFSGGRKKKAPIIPSYVAEAAGIIDSNSKNHSSGVPGSTANNGSSLINSLYPSASLDPPQGYVRLISSSRLTPHSVIALAAKTDFSVLFPTQCPSIPPSRLCENCNMHVRKYACPITGASLCSLECFKALSSTRILSLSK